MKSLHYKHQHRQHFFFFTSLTFFSFWQNTAHSLWFTILYILVHRISFLYFLQFVPFQIKLKFCVFQVNTYLFLIFKIQHLSLVYKIQFTGFFYTYNLFKHTQALIVFNHGTVSLKLILFNFLLLNDQSLQMFLCSFVHLLVSRFSPVALEHI